MGHKSPFVDRFVELLDSGLKYVFIVFWLAMVVGGFMCTKAFMVSCPPPGLDHVP
jgi:hypothetical protein